VKCFADIVGLIHWFDVIELGDTLINIAGPST